MLKKGATLASIAPKIKTLRSKYDKESPKWKPFFIPSAGLIYMEDLKMEKKAGTHWNNTPVCHYCSIYFINCLYQLYESFYRPKWKKGKGSGYTQSGRAEKGSLIRQFLGESILISFIAGIFALLIITIALPYFGNLVQRKLSINFSDYHFGWQDWASFSSPGWWQAATRPYIFRL